jgi:hypothetical protein
MKYKYTKYRSRNVNTFTINNRTYSIRFSEHADNRLNDRKLDLYQCIGAILSLGEKRILEYSNSGRDIFIMDNTNKFSIVCYIDKCTIYVITLLDKIDCYVKDGTDIINL